jgi:hypothetical protein
MPESFNVLVKEIRSLGIDVEAGRQRPAPGLSRQRTCSID